MFRVTDIYDDAKKIVGSCDDTVIFRWLSDAVTLISNKEDLEGWKGYLDICTRGCTCNTGTGDSVCNNPAGCGRKCITLPREVETVIAVNIGGQPVLGYGQLFEFHLNGPGSCRTVCEWKWQDMGRFHSTYRDLITPAHLVVYTATPDDNNKSFIVFGYDEAGRVLRRLEGGVWRDGLRLMMKYGYAIPDVDQPRVARITGIDKEVTAGNVRLSTIDDSGSTGVLLGVYEPDETVPQYRRIMLNRSCNWARIAYRKATPNFTSKYDHVPLQSRIAFLLALQARKSYQELQIADAHSYEADAARLELEAQAMLEAPTYSPPQVIDMSNPRDHYDYDIR